MVLGVAEYVLGRPVRRVLDVGCGEAAWRAPILALRPRAAYVGVDPSEYVLRRFGRARGIRRGALATLGELPLRGRFDLVLCADVLHYLPADEVRQGLRAMAALVRGVAYLPLFTTSDAVEGDVRGLRRRAPRWYRDRMRGAGLLPIGLDCHVPRAVWRELTATERSAALARGAPAL